MNDETGFIAAVVRELAASTAVILAAWGALGGATNALTTKMRLRDAIRHILLGGLIPINYQDKQTKTMAPERVQDVAHLLATLVDRLRRCAQGSTLSIQGGSLLSRIPSFRMKKSERPRTACCRDIWLNKCRFLIT